ncbi:MAG: sulfatase [Pseudomonadota bacterium]
MRANRNLESTRSLSPSNPCLAGHDNGDATSLRIPGAKLVRRSTLSIFSTLSGLGILLAVGCNDGAAGKNGEGASPGSRSEKTAVQKSVRSGLETVRSLIAEAGRAEVSANGLLIDLGTNEQHKYTFGGWHNGWGEPQSHGSVTYAAARSRSVPLRVLFQGSQVHEVAVKLRAPRAGQRVSLLVDGKHVRDRDVPTSWGIVRFPLAAGVIQPGWLDIHLVFGSVQVGGVRADVDWVWLSNQAGSEPSLSPRLVPLTLGERTLRSLAAKPPREYTFYFEVPSGASLVFDYGAEAATTFVVRLASDRAGRKEMFRAEAAPGQWKEARVDLATFSGRAVGLSLATDGAAGLAAWGEPELMVPRQSVPSTDEGRATDRPVGVIVVLIDTARADAFDTDSSVHTPVFDALAKESTVFTKAYANENWTKPSVATVLSGLYPSTHGAKEDGDVLSAEVELLSERLKKGGYATAAFIANGFCSDTFGFHQGWDDYTNYIREKKPSDAESVYRDALAWLSKTKERPFFLYIQTIDPHVPYQVPKEYWRRYHSADYHGWIGPSLDGHEQAAISKGRKKASAADYQWIRALYDGEVSYHDEHLGRFLAATRQLGILDRTLLVVTADHGEELNDHGKLGHGHTLYDELVRAPLLVRYPKVFRAGHRVAEVVELVDVAPTILDVVGLKPGPAMEGLSLVHLAAARLDRRQGYAISEFLDTKRSIRTGGLKLIFSTPESAQLFDLVSDPNERKDLAASHPIARRLCETYLGEGLAIPSKARRQSDMFGQRRRYQGGTAKMDSVLKRQLEALGYLGH